MTLSPRPWIATDDTIRALAGAFDARELDDRHRALLDAVAENRRIHEVECINLNPATNIMNPAAEAMLAAGLGSRPSLGHPGDKYEMGLEAIERIEVYAATLACEVFRARHAEIRVASGAMANLYAFMACCRPGDTVIVPPASIGGHVTHHHAGAAGLYGLNIVEAPVDAGRYTVDVDALETLARQCSPRLVTIGGSLNLAHHPVAEIRAIADRHGAKVLFDAAHLSGLIAGDAWPNPLAAGAHLVSMSTYKSLGGPPSGLLLINDDELAERVDAIAFPGLTANFDAAKSAALVVTLLDWLACGREYASKMVETCADLHRNLVENDIPVFAAERLAPITHQLAVEAAPFAGGQAMARTLRGVNLLACGIGLPLPAVAGDLNGLRLGTPETTRRGFAGEAIGVIARCIADALTGRRPAAQVRDTVTALSAAHRELHYLRATPGEVDGASVHSR